MRQTRFEGVSALCDSVDVDVHLACLLSSCGSPHVCSRAGYAEGLHDLGVRIEHDEEGNDHPEDWTAESRYNVISASPPASCCASEKLEASLTVHQLRNGIEIADSQSAMRARFTLIPSQDTA